MKRKTNNGYDTVIGRFQDYLCCLDLCLVTMEVEIYL